MPSADNSIDLHSSSLSISQCYLIYVDRLGTTSIIRKDDCLYGNREGFYGMAPLYVEPYEVLVEVLGKQFRYFGFSDTIIAVLETDDVTTIGKAASKVFSVLLSFSIATRVFITKGDFSFHRFEQLAERPDTFLCPIYGSTLLDAYELDKLGMKCLGAFAHKSVINQFETMPNVKFQNEAEVGFINLKSYLTDDEISKIKSKSHGLPHLSNGAITLHCETLGEALSGNHVVVRTNQGSRNTTP